MSESGDKEVNASQSVLQNDANEEAQEEAAQEEAAPATDASPELPKGRIKRPTRPDDASHKQKMDALQDIIKKNKSRGEELKQILDDRKSGKSAGSSGQQAIKNKLAELRNQWQTVLKQKQQLRAQMETATKTRDAVRSSLRDLKSSMKFTTVEQIDEAIDKLEHRVQHSSLSLNEEKQVLDDIRKLKASRAAVGEYSGKLDVLAQDDSSRAELMSGIKALDEELTSIRAEEEVHRAELAVLREKEAEATSDVPALLAERTEVKEVCKQAYEKIKDLRTEHDGLWTEFKAQEKLWRAQQDVDRAARREEAVAERKARDAERAARLAEMAPEPFDREVTMCDQLKAYLGRYVGASAAATSGAAAAEPEKEVAALDGMKVFTRKKEDEEDEWMLSSAKGGKKGKAKGKKSGGNAAAAPAASSGKIVHSVDMLEAFATLKISVPTSSAAVPGILSTVEELKADFLKKREEVKAAKEAAKGAEAPAADAAGGVAAIEEGEIVEAGPAKKKVPGKKAAAPAPLPTLDDVTSWPVMGETPATPAAAEQEEADEEKAAEEPAAAAVGEEAGTAPEPVKAAAPASNGGVSVAFTVSDTAGVTLAISAGSD